MLKLRHSGLRRVLALALVLAMVFSAMPARAFSVFAEDEEPTMETVLPEETQDEQNEADPEPDEGLTEPLAEDTSEPGEIPPDEDVILVEETEENEGSIEEPAPVADESLIDAAVEQVALKP